MLLAARALGEEARHRRRSPSTAQPHKGQLIRALRPAELEGRRAHHRQHGRCPGRRRRLGDRRGADAGARVSKGFTIERTYYTLDGKKVDLASATGGTSQLKQNERLVVVLKVEAPETGGRILLVDRLPAGLEIENPRLVDCGDVKTLGWLKTTLKPQHTEFRDDRFVAAFDFFGGRRPPRPARSTATRSSARRPARRHGRLHGAGGDAGLVRAPGRDGGGHVPPRPLRPHRLRPARRHAEGVIDALAP